MQGCSFKLLANVVEPRKAPEPDPVLSIPVHAQPKRGNWSNGPEKVKVKQLSLPVRGNGGHEK